MYCTKCKRLVPRSGMTFKSVGPHLMASCSCGTYLKFVPQRDRVQFDFGKWTMRTEYFNGIDVMSFVVNDGNIHFTFQVDRTGADAPRITTFNQTENAEDVSRNDAHFAATIVATLTYVEVPELADAAEEACFRALLNGSEKARAEEEAIQNEMRQQKIEFPEE